MERPPSGRVPTHPLRNRLLHEYATAPASPSAVARRLGERVNLVAYHTGVLLRQGHVELDRIERARGVVTHWYRSTVRAALDDEEWAALPLAMRRGLTLGTLGQVEVETRRSARDGGFDHREAHLSRVRLELDHAGRREVAQRLLELDQAVAGLVARCHARQPPEQDLAPYRIVVLGFDAQR
jgi:hypothetical protein